MSIGYAIILACSFKRLSHIECYDWVTTFLLVIAMAISTFGQYFIGISYSALIQADQRVYIVNVLSIMTTIINTLMVFVLVCAGSSLVFVKFVSSCVFLLKPIAMKVYVKKKYGLIASIERDKDVLSQRWTGLGQHFAYYIHSNTDVAVLTFFENLKIVSVYSVYHMVTNNIQNIVTALCSGMEPLFGDMIARNEKNQLNEAFAFYENMTSIVCCILYSTTFVMIIPFIKLYTHGVEDTNYVQPVFAYLLTAASIIFSLRFPYQHTITAAGHFKRTRMGAYGEAIINVCVSIALVWKFGIVGVAIGTIVAIGFRLVYSVRYLSKEILKRPVTVFLKRSMVNILNTGIIVVVFALSNHSKSIENYGQWFVEALFVTMFGGVITVVINLCFYRRLTSNMLKQLWRMLGSVILFQKHRY